MELFTGLYNPAMLRVSHETRDRVNDPQGWTDYLADAEDLIAADAPIRDE